MRRNNAAVIVLVLLLPIMAWAADTAQQLKRLMIEPAAGGTRVWVGEVRSSSAGDRTVIWQRDEGEKAWRTVAEIPGDVLELSAVTGRLAAVLPGGQWQFVNLATGPALPGEVQLAALAGDGDALWAVGRAGVPSTAPTQPATGEPPLAPGLHLFSLQRGEWHHVAPMPLGVDGEVGKGFSLAVAESRPTVAAVGPGETIDGLAGVQASVWQWHGDKWVRRASLPLAQPVDAIRVFDSLDRVAVWTAVQNQLGELRVLVGDQVHLLQIAGQAAVRDIDQAGGMIRIIYADGDKVMERRFDPQKFQEDAKAAELPLQQLGEEPGYLKWVQGFMLALLVAAMASTMMRRNKQAIKIDFRKVRLAPFGRRIGAALIDAIPLLIGMFWIGSQYPDLRDYQDAYRVAESLSRMPDRLLQLGLIVGIYLLLLTVTEMFFGRSIGKMLTGLRIVRLDGQAPGAVALFVRNFMRLIDLWMGITLVLVIMLPLRQRIGDIVAGTVVIADLPSEEDDLGGDDSGE